MKKIVRIVALVAIMISLFWAVRDLTTKEYRGDALYSTTYVATGIESFDDYFAYGLMGYNGISRSYDAFAVVFLFLGLAMARKLNKKECWISTIIAMITLAASISFPRATVWLSTLAVVLIAVLITMAMIRKNENWLEASIASASFSAFLLSVWFGGTLVVGLFTVFLLFAMIATIITLAEMSLPWVKRTIRKWIGRIPIFAKRSLQ